MNLLGNPTVEFCEKAGVGLIKRPFYALSNLFYIFLGFFILSRNTKFSKEFGYTALFIGLASMAYDITYTYISQLIDLLGMFIFVNLLIFLSTKRLMNISTLKLLVYQAILILLGFGGILYFKSFFGGFVFGFFIILHIILETILWRKGKTRDIRLWLCGLLLFVLGFGVWIFDAMKIWCDPSDMFNGRGVFHLLTAGTIYLLYLYFDRQD